MDTSMHLKNFLLRITCFLKVPINIRCKSKIVILFILRFGYLWCQISYNLISLMRIFLSVHKQSWSIEPPEKMRMLHQKTWISAMHEIEFVSEGRISRPKSIFPSKIRQTWISTHASSSPNQQKIRLSDKPSSC